MTGAQGELRQTDDRLSSGEAKVAGSRMPAQLPGWFFIDWLLVILAVGSSAWACVSGPASERGDFPRRVTLLEEEMTWPQEPPRQTMLYVDRDNMIHLRDETFDGHGRLAVALQPAPERVWLLVDPDSLFETVRRTISVLQYCGVQVVEIATSQAMPFSSTSDAEPAESARESPQARPVVE